VKFTAHLNPRGFFIGILRPTTPFLSLSARCAVIHSIPPGGVKEFQCGGMDGRYVNVVIPRQEYLTLCEVEVYGSRLD